MEDNLRNITCISLQPGAIWKYSREHREQLEESLVSIASSTDGSCEIFLTIEDDSTMIDVFRGEDMVYQEAIVSDEDAVATVRKIYAQFLPDVSYSGGYQGTGYTRQELEDDMYDREEELCSAMEDFLNVAVEGFFDAYFGKDADVTQEIVDLVCKHLADEYGVSVRYPRFDYDKAGNETYVEFPYEDQEEEKENDPDE